MEHLEDTAVYGRRVIELFEAPGHAGPPSGAGLVGEAISRPRASWVRLYLRIVKESVDAAGFEALACPHTIAAAELVCKDIEGSTLRDLAGYDGAFLDTALPLPPDKLDIRILLEDAVRNAAAGGR